MSFTESLSPENLSSYDTEYKLSIDPKVSYFLHGKAGTGKTFTSLQIAKNWIKEGSKITGKNLDDILYLQFHRFIDLVKSARNSFGDGEDNYRNKMKIKELYDLPLLIIDDLGTEKNTEFVDEIIFDLVNFRYENRLQTIFTSNFSLSEIETKYHERIADRIKGMCQVIELKGESYRAKKEKVITNFNNI